MGGGLILVSIIVSTLLWADIHNNYIWVLLIVTLGFGLIGFMDDLKKVIYKDPNGISAGQKYLWQSVIGLGASIYLWSNAVTPEQTSLIVPFFKDASFAMNGLTFILLSYFVIVGSSNAVNLTDGLDGLAIMPAVLVASALGVFSYVAGNYVIAKYLGIPYISGAGELAIFCTAMAGAGLGFLWFNTYPAEVFMGDLGALALGAAIGTIAVIVRQEIVLFIMGGIFVVETFSVAIQVMYFKYTKFRYGIGKRIFLMAPLHHHFQLKGWAEQKIVIRFWILTILFFLTSLMTLKLR